MTADELKEKRIFLGLTQAKLATKFGLTERTIRNYENGATQIPRTFIMAFEAMELEEK